MTCEDGKEPFPCFVFRMFTAGERWRPREEDGAADSQATIQLRTL